MKKTILLFSIICCALNSNAQNLDIIQEEVSPVPKTEKQIQNAVDFLLKNKELLNIKLDTRIDYHGKFGDDAIQEGSFKAQTIKLVFDGEIVPGVRYLVRQRLNKPQDASLTRENFGSATDFAYIELDAGSRWSFRIGKQPTALGTFEFDYNPADVYLSTIVNNDFDGYKTGVNTSYKAGKHILNFQLINSDAPQFASDDYKNKAIAGIFLWQGSFFDDVFKTRYGYGMFQHNGHKVYNWLAIGNQLNLNQLTTELDFFMGNRNISFSETLPEEKYVRDQAVSLNLAYTLGKFKPIVKCTWNKRRDQETSGSMISKGIQAGAEYFPFTAPLLKNFRFHLVYVYEKSNFNGVYKNINDINQSAVYAGMRWLFKIM